MVTDQMPLVSRVIGIKEKAGAVASSKTATLTAVAVGAQNFIVVACGL